jgi:G3E family GTPase
VDALNFEKVYATAVVVPDQIKQSSLVVINKTDLAGDETAEKVERVIRNINPECEICRAVYAEIPGNLLIGLKPKTERVLGGKQDLLSGALCFRVTNKPGMENFRRLIDRIKPAVYRCKGYAPLLDGDYFVDGVMDNVSFLRVEGQHTSGLTLLYKTSGGVKKTLQKIAAENCIETELD